MKKQFLILFIFLIASYFSFSQQENPEPGYPKIVGFASILHPLVSVDKNGNTFNFKNSYTIGFPVGINIIKTSKIGFSLEIVPYIKSAKGIDQVSNLLIHPGLMFLLKRDYKLIMRMAFETEGRYGLTPTLNKTLIKTKNINYLVAASAPLRFGNEKPPSIGLSFQFGICF